ncbi:MAG: NAD(P)-dependent oxidoreductase [bacterium]|nr:NAD(P)-dependent oxidoreductase [bacterium]
MKMAFFEVQGWEKEMLAKAFPDALLIEEKLTEENADTYADVEIISCFIYSSCSKIILDKLPKLTYVATRSTGYDHIDVAYAATKRITVSNVPEYGSRTVAEFTFALILNLTRKIYQAVNQAKQFNFDHPLIRGVDLYGKTLGIVGLGKIGGEVLKIAQGFGMKALVSTRSEKKELLAIYDMEFVELDELLTRSDIVTLHLPSMKDTYHIINKENIMKMKKKSYLVNTARGGLIDIEAVILGLENGILEGVALDVLEEENEMGEEVNILSKDYKEKMDFKTLFLNHVLMNNPKVIITPHNAFNSEEALLRITETTIFNIQEFSQGRMANLVF